MKKPTYTELKQRYESAFDECMHYLHTVGHASECDESELRLILSVAKRALSPSEYNKFLDFTIELECD